MSRVGNQTSCPLKRKRKREAKKKKKEIKKLVESLSIEKKDGQMKRNKRMLGLKYYIH